MPDGTVLHAVLEENRALGVLVGKSRPSYWAWCVEVTDVHMGAGKDIEGEIAIGGLPCNDSALRCR